MPPPSDAPAVELTSLDELDALLTAGERLVAEIRAHLTTGAAWAEGEAEGESCD